MATVSIRRKRMVHAKISIRKHTTMPVPIRGLRVLGMDVETGSTPVAGSA